MRISRFALRRRGTIARKPRTAAWRLIFLGSIVLWVVACSAPRTPGDSAIDFNIAVQGGQLDRAYDLLCPESQTRLSRAPLELKSLEDLSPILLLPSWSLTDLKSETTDSSVSAWIQVDAFPRRDPNSVQSAPLASQRWRIDLDRVDGEWKVCGFERLPDTPPYPGR